MAKSQANLLIQALSDRLAEDLQHFPDFLRAFAYDILWPAIVALIFLYSVVLIRNTRRSKLPPSAADLHHQALLALQSSRLGLSKTAEATVTNGDRQQETLTLLWKAIDMDPDYVPAIQSLVAFYIYRQPNAAAALRVLSLEAVAKHSKQFDRLVADAQALASGNASMIQKDLGIQAYLTLKSLI